MYDIHCHILPGVDDGAIDIEESLQMAEIASKSGVKTIVATPHCNISGLYENYLGKWYYESIDKLRMALTVNDININILPGMEVYATEDLPSLICDNKIQMINNTNYMLMEFGFDDPLDYMEYIIQKVQELKVKPIIAHVERYYCIQDHPNIIKKWKKDGCMIQVNKDSFEGAYGISEEDTAYLLLEDNVISALASDAHGADYRNPDMSNIKMHLYSQYGEPKIHPLVFENIREICKK